MRVLISLASARRTLAYMRLGRWTTRGSPASRWLFAAGVVVPCIALMAAAVVVGNQPAPGPATQRLPDDGSPVGVPEDPPVSVADLLPVVAALPEPEVPEPGPPPRPAFVMHTVGPGDTVQGIAGQYGVAAETVLGANALDDPDLLQVAQQLRVPTRDGILYTVAAGESLRSIAERYGVDVDVLIEANDLNASPDLVPVGAVLVLPGVTPAARVAQAESDPAPRERQVALVDEQGAAATSARRPIAAADAPSTYVVREGDTLRSIAEASGLDILTLVAINRLVDPDLIRPGSTLRTSSADTREHVVRPGETLADIAWRYSVSTAVLLEANSLANPDLIVTGMTLVLPGSQPETAAPPPRPTALVATSVPTANSRRATAAPPPTPTPAPRAAAPAAAARPSTQERVITARVTGYALGAGAVSTRTASGTVAHWGSVAADTRLYPFGTHLRIEGLEGTVFVVEDTGGAVRGNVFDVWFPDAASARRLGARTRQVTILPPGAP